MEPTKVGDVMARDPVTIAQDLPLDVALEAMRANNVRRLPVVSETGRVIGILTLYDALIATRKEVGDFMSEVASPMPLVRDAMTANVYTIEPDESLARAARIMTSYKVGALPVVDKNKHLIGIVTESDLFRILAELLEG